MTLCGHEPFAHRINTDHRALCMDFDADLLFGNKTLALAPMKGREIQATCRSQVAVYLESFGKLIESRNLLDRSTESLKADNPNHELAERLD